MSRHTGIASLPLHTGKAPPWLFSRMARLSREIVSYMVAEYGAREVLRRLSDPFWFQAFGCVLGFDWHSSGVTTTVCGAVKEGLKDVDRELGLFAAGGKGATSRKTPAQIEVTCERLGRDPTPLVYASRMAAKVDSAAVQDGYQLYHHAFFFTAAGEWCVVQQGMSDATRLARRYHWLAELAAQPPQVALEALAKVPELKMPVRHTLFPELDVPDRHLQTILTKTYERAPKDFEALLGIEGVGAKTVRALALASQLVHGKQASLRDPARFAFAHGGKDGTPFPVDRITYDKTIEILNKAINRASIDRTEK